VAGRTTTVEKSRVFWASSQRAAGRGAGIRRKSIEAQHRRGRFARCCGGVQDAGALLIAGAGAAEKGKEERKKERQRKINTVEKKKKKKEK